MDKELVFPSPYGAGMTLRDYFAALAMQSLVLVSPQGGGAWAAAEAYKFADAMIAQREPQSGGT